MPGTRCIVATCNNSRLKNNKDGLKLIYHSFPKDKALKAKWIDYTRREGKWNPDTSYVCSQHFADDDYERDLEHELLGLPPRKKLKYSAFPHLNIGTPLKKVNMEQSKRRATRLTKRHMKQDVNRLINESHLRGVVERSNLIQDEDLTTTISSTQEGPEVSAELTEAKEQLLRQNYENCDPKIKTVKEEVVTDDDEGNTSPGNFETNESLSTTFFIKDEYCEYEIQDNQVVNKEVKEEPINSDDSDNSKDISDDFLNDEMKPLHHEVDISDYEADDHQENEIDRTSNKNQEPEDTLERDNSSDQIEEREATFLSESFQTGSGEKLMKYSCDYCKKGFTTKKDLTSHMRVHTREHTLSCKICKKGFSYKSQLIIHNLTHTIINPLSCKFCKKSFYSKVELTEHIQVHSEEKPFSCKICKKGYSYKSQLTQHIRVHTKEKLFSCEICKKTFSNKGRLTEHIRVHTEENPFSCEICNNAFPNKSKLADHILVHTGDMNFSCEICKMRFFFKSTLTEHIRVHTGEKPFSCKFCKKGFSFKSKLTEHIRVHTGEKPFFCKICKKAFSYKSQLAIHIQLHTGEMPFSCQICKKGFPYKSKLAIHNLRHTRKNSFSCEICNKEFYFKNQLRKHIRVHTGEKSFSCEICKKSFNNKLKLTRHIKIHSKKKPFSGKTCK